MTPETIIPVLVFATGFLSLIKIMSSEFDEAEQSAQVKIRTKK